MSSRLPLYKPQQVVRKFKRADFVEFHRKGSHLVLKNYKSRKIVVVPMHYGKDIPKGLLHNIIKHQAGMTIEEFIKL
jgi:predicted RNA binding protein YcfA (HicA-like mRNA interferase family)